MKNVILAMQIIVYSLFLLLVIKDFLPNLLIFNTLTTPTIVVSMIILSLVETILSSTTKIKTNKEHFWISSISISLFVLLIVIFVLQGIQSQSGLVNPVLFLLFIYTIYETHKNYKEMKKTTELHNV
ncbi:phosphatidylserine synthase [Alkalicoccobacillus murimartini]|uniref:Phosphatidylserine synthase n=1 Tax=Alkalicoccobacillus murimartini TaxID=171685 RepID=A0ABT9YMC8_9BACI|nr:phosphatidylserine synthase [Alkalicoccobacillus murimartini]